MLLLLLLLVTKNRWHLYFNQLSHYASLKSQLRPFAFKLIIEGSSWFPIVLLVISLVGSIITSPVLCPCEYERFSTLLWWTVINYLQASSLFIPLMKFILFLSSHGWGYVSFSSVHIIHLRIFLQWCVVVIIYLNLCLFYFALISHVIYKITSFCWQLFPGLEKYPSMLSLLLRLLMRWLILLQCLCG